MTEMLQLATDGKPAELQLVYSHQIYCVLRHDLSSE